MNIKSVGWVILGIGVVMIILAFTSSIAHCQVKTIMPCRNVEQRLEHRDKYGELMWVTYRPCPEHLIVRYGTIIGTGNGNGGIDIDNACECLVRDVIVHHPYSVKPKEKQPTVAGYGNDTTFISLESDSVWVIPRLCNKIPTSFRIVCNFQTGKLKPVWKWTK